MVSVLLHVNYKISLSLIFNLLYLKQTETVPRIFQVNNFGSGWALAGINDAVTDRPQVKSSKGPQLVYKKALDIVVLIISPDNKKCSVKKGI